MDFLARLIVGISTGPLQPLALAQFIAALMCPMFDLIVDSDSPALLHFDAALLNMASVTSDGEFGDSSLANASSGYIARLAVADDRLSRCSFW